MQWALATISWRLCSGLVGSNTVTMVGKVAVVGTQTPQNTALNQRSQSVRYVAFSVKVLSSRNQFVQCSLS
ncbi:hypothetical protein F5X98DRAFT_333568 [Xylaria grammica]|nr:hypothetical protein F5X98DRAFT_333568 [Xylaria grammica]